ncbi:MAG: response regulator [Candidatus Melainabacteria bacterium]|nr:response regulator [Candidatus Melainabacteria bacterium]
MESQRDNYITRCLERLSPMESHANRFAQSPWDVDNLKQLHEHFHQMAGSAGVYNLNEITGVAESGERLCLNIFESQPDDIIVYWRHFREMIAQLRSILDQARGTAGPSAAASDGPPPLSSQPATQVFESELTPNMVPNQGPDVIVVSSDQARLSALSQRLDSLGMSVRPCASWTEAKDQIMTKFPQGLLLCVPLKDGNGYDLITGCRSLPGGANVSIVLLSEEPGFLDKIAAIKAGADAFFELPVEVDVIVQKLRFLFERGKPERYRILSVEDDPDQANYIVTTLENAGYNIAWVQDPKKFEEALLTFVPDLVLLDIVMGEINGFELARFVRQNERFAALPILFLTTQNQLEAHIESARAGGDDHLIKPVNPQLLVATIAGKLERYRIFQRLLRNDGLTQILNHSHFMEYAQRSVRVRSKKFAQVLTIFDIDGLGRLNDTYGYAVGDRTIQALVQIIKWTFRHTEIIGRIGGDEIAVLDDSLSAQESVEVVKGLLEQFAAVPHKAAGQIFRVTASAGISHVGTDGNLQTLIERSTESLKRAKANGQNQVMML